MKTGVLIINLATVSAQTLFMIYLGKQLFLKIYFYFYMRHKKFICNKNSLNILLTTFIIMW